MPITIKISMRQLEGLRPTPWDGNASLTLSCRLSLLFGIQSDKLSNTAVNCSLQLGLLDFLFQHSNLYLWGRRLEFYFPLSTVGPSQVKDQLCSKAKTDAFSFRLTAIAAFVSKHQGSTCSCLFPFIFQQSNMNFVFSRLGLMKYKCALSSTSLWLSF